QGELHVAAALDAERADDLERRAAELLVLLVRDRLRRRHHDRVAGVHPHRIDVLHVAHRDAGIRSVAHDLPLELLPAQQAAFDEDLADRRRADTTLRALAERGGVARESTAGP